MPCDTVITNTVDLGKVAADHPELLEAALRTEFGAVTVRGQKISTLHGERDQRAEFIFDVDGKRVVLQGGRATSLHAESRLQEIVGQVNQAVSRQAVGLAAQRFGWSVKYTNVAKTKFQLVKR